MSTQTSGKSPTIRPPGGPLQFRLWHLLAAPVVLGLVLGVARWAGLSGVAALLALGGVASLLFRRTRAGAVPLLITAGYLHVLALAVSDTRTPSSQGMCINNMNQIALALLHYESVWDCFPPPYIADAQGRPLYSWRVLLLPYLGRRDLAQSWHYDEPWDSANNRSISMTEFTYFQCPSDKSSGPGMTSYVAVVGPGTIWPEQGGVSFDDISDGASNTLMLVEVAGAGIYWAEPRDLNLLRMSPRINSPKGLSISSNHPGGAIVTFVDGRQQFVSENLTPEDVRALLTISGGEEVDWQRY